MSRINPDEILTKQHVRIWRQPGGPRFDRPVKYSGVDSQYITLMGLTIPVKGGVNPIRVPDPFRRKNYRIVGSQTDAPDYATATIHVLEKHGAIPFPLSDLDCPGSLYLQTGACDTPGDFLASWSDYIAVIENYEVTESNPGDRMAWDSDEQLESELSITIGAVYAVGSLSFGQKAPSEISREVVDAIYARADDCVDCPDSTKRAYAVTKSSGSGSPGLPAEVIWTNDGWSTRNQVNIDGFGATEDPLAIDLAGNYLIVLGSNAYYYAEINRYTGAPGAFTKVVSGFVAAKDPQDMYVASPSEIYFCGKGGYIYRASDVTIGVEAIDAGQATTADLSRIHGYEDCIVATGASTTIVFSQNRGITFAAPTTSPTGLSLTISALHVVDRLTWWIGTQTSGRVYVTINGGESWSAINFSGSGSGSVRDIVFATPSVGYFVYDTNTPTAQLFSTWNGGANWARNGTASRRILSWPTFNRANRIAVPKGGAHPTIASNNLMIAGLAGDGSDGILLVGAADIL